MSTSAISFPSLHQQLEVFFHTREADLAQLNKDLQSGDLAAAKQDYSAIVTLGKSGPFSHGNAFYVPQREQDFNAVGQALQSGDLAGAQQAFAALRQTFRPPTPVPPMPPQEESGSSTNGLSVSA